MQYNDLDALFHAAKSGDEKTAADDACKIEHYISEASFEAIKKHLRECGQIGGDGE